MPQSRHLGLQGFQLDARRHGLKPVFIDATGLGGGNDAIFVAVEAAKLSSRLQYEQYEQYEQY